MPDRIFLDKLLQKLKVGDSRSIHLNALPGNFARLDIYDLVNIEPSLHLKFLQNLLNKPNFSLSITIDPAIIDSKKKEEADIIRKMIRRLNLMHYQEQDELLEHGTRTFGFGYPLLIMRDASNPSKIIKAPLFIWYLDLQKDTQRNNTWTISRREDEHTMIFNEMLKGHLETTEQISMEELANFQDEDILNEKGLLERVQLLIEKLGGKGVADSPVTILPGSDRQSIEKITGDSPWIRWSGIFGMYKTQKQSIIKDIEDLKNTEIGLDWNTLYDTYQKESATPVLLDPSQETVLNSLFDINKVIIQGPPGTGKSQTLTAIIANALYNRSTCLVVCEKRTALEVLQQNLKELGLGDLCVLVDDIYADRKKVVERVRALTDSPAQPPLIRQHDYEELNAKQHQLKKELNRHLGIVNNRFFGDDNWLDITGWYLSLINSQENTPFEGLDNEAYEFDYKEFRTFMPIIEQGEKLWKKAGNIPFDIYLQDWLFRLPTSDILNKLNTWLKHTEELLLQYKTAIDAYGENYLLIDSWHTKKVNSLGWLVSSWGKARDARNTFQTTYDSLSEEWKQNPYLNLQLTKPGTYTTLEEPATALRKAYDLLHPLAEQLPKQPDYILWRQFCTSQPENIAILLTRLSTTKCPNWVKHVEYWYADQVLQKMAALYDLGGSVEEVSLELSAIESKWRSLLTDATLLRWYEQRREVLKTRDITFVKNLYNLRKNKQFGIRNSLRKIIHTDLDLFKAMFPIVLVNPGVCSSIIPLQEGVFDIVLLDEASQLRLEDTFPSLIRGKSKVISGDKHQMPPSGFFQSQVAFMDLGDEEEAEEDNTKMVAGSLAESESLLEFAGDTDYSLTYLDFHYRSRHPDLIQFSNAAFYGSRLVPMPQRKDYTAIEYHAINGLYDGQGINRKEAEAVTNYVFNSIQPNQDGHFPGVGIGTFNINQRNLIWDLILEMAYGNEEKSGKLAGLMQSGLFVKNLENIQGDERDIMILSTTFGPNSEGKFRQMFGPLTQSKGYQLLNVIVTRAKDKILLFSSFPDAYIASYPEHLQEKGNTGKGILYAYLAYAKAVSTGNIAMKEAVLSNIAKHSTDQPIAGRTQSNNDRFREWLKSVLESLPSNFNVVNEYAFGGFILDLAIMDAEGKILLAIECEGAAYYGSGEAYRYHLYRRDMLKKYGIKAFYAWSYNFWKDADGEIKRIQETINNKETTTFK